MCQECNWPQWFVKVKKKEKCPCGETARAFLFRDGTILIRCDKCMAEDSPPQEEVIMKWTLA